MERVKGADQNNSSIRKCLEPETSQVASQSGGQSRRKPDGQQSAERVPRLFEGTLGSVGKKCECNGTKDFHLVFHVC